MVWTREQITTSLSVGTEVLSTGVHSICRGNSIETRRCSGPIESESIGIATVTVSQGPLLPAAVMRHANRHAASVIEPDLKPSFQGPANTSSTRTAFGLK